MIIQKTSPKTHGFFFLFLPSTKRQREKIVRAKCGRQDKIRKKKKKKKSRRSRGRGNLKRRGREGGEDDEKASKGRCHCHLHLKQMAQHGSQTKDKWLPLSWTEQDANVCHLILHAHTLRLFKKLSKQTPTPNNWVTPSQLVCSIQWNNNNRYRHKEG